MSLTSFVVAMLHAVAGSVLLAIIFGFCNSALSHASAVLALGGGLILGALSWWHGRNAQRLPRPGFWTVCTLALFAIFSFRAFLWLIFRNDDGLYVLSPNNLGDVSLHIALIRNLANGAPFWPDSPIFSQGKLTYSVGMDLFNALLSLTGVELLRGLIWTGLLGALASALALIRWGGAFTAAAFLCNGGLAALAWLTSASETPLFQDWQAGWAWKNFALSVLVTQRGFLFALPAGLLLLTSWRTRFLRDGEGWKIPFASELLLYAAMPAFHLHTFMALSFILGTLLVARPKARAKIERIIAAAFVPATVLCWLSVGMFKTNVEPRWEHMSQFENPPARPAANVLGWQPGWMVNDDNTNRLWSGFANALPGAAPFPEHGKFLIFWFGNFGVLPLLLVPLLLALLRPVLPRAPSPLAAWAMFASLILFTPLMSFLDFRSATFPFLRTDALPLVLVTFAFCVFLARAARTPDTGWPTLMAIPALYLFFVCCNVRFANWDWDNTKLMLWAWLIVFAALWETVLSKWRLWRRAAVCMALFFSGFISLLGGINGQFHGFGVARLTTLDAVEQAVHDIPVTETFAAAPDYKHPLLLCGRKVVMGYTGHLASHGIQYAGVQDDLDALMQGSADWRLRAAQLGARYLYFGPDERAFWPGSTEAWREGAALVASGEWGEIFDLHTPPLPLDEDANAMLRSAPRPPPQESGPQ